MSDIFNGILGGIQGVGRGIGTLLGQTYDPNLASLEAFKKYLGFDVNQNLNSFQLLDLQKAYDNALTRQTAQNEAALKPWGLVGQGLGALANWWGMSKGANLAEKALKNQLAFQRANLYNTNQLLQESREARERDAAKWSNRQYVAPTPLMYV